MKILLINPPHNSNINTWTPDSTNKAIGCQPPLGLAYLAAVLEKNGYQVSILDMEALGIGEEGARKRITKENPDIVGITTMTLIVRSALKVAKIAKDAGATVVAGGPHLSVFPRETLSFDFVDYGIYGDAEYALIDLVKGIEKGKSLDRIKGLIYKSNGVVHVNEPAIIENLDELPFPAVHLLPQERYSLANALHPFASIITMRGCPYHCGFCLRDPVNKLVRFRNPKSVVDEMENRIINHNVREINICNDTLTFNREHIIGICDEILNRGLKIRWQAPTRVDAVDPELLKFMSRAGCKTLRYGVESGDQTVLDLMKKGIKIEQTRSAFKWTKEAGIEIMAYFIIGYIDETPQSVERTIRFAKELEPDGAVFAIGTPLPETDLFNLACRKRLVDEHYWSNYTLGFETRRIPYLIEDAERWLRKAIRTFYFRPKYILRCLLKIRSWDSLKKHILGAFSFLRFRMYRRGDPDF